MKIRPFNDMYNTDIHKYFNAREVCEVTDELGAEYIGAGLAELVEEKERAEPTPEPFGNSEQLLEAETPEPPEDQPEEMPEEANDQQAAETPKKARARKK